MEQSELEAIARKCGKTRAYKSRLVWVLLLIGRESGTNTNIFSQSQGEVKQKQSKARITFDTQLKASPSVNW